MWKEKFVASLVAVSLSMAGVYSALTQFLPHTPITARRSTISLLMAEGWGFFTRDPREEDLFSYFPGDNPGEWVHSYSVPNASWRNVFGLQRWARGRGPELVALMNAMDPDDWSLDEICGVDHAQCLNMIDSFLPLLNDTPNPSLCGRVGFVVQVPIPWAWSGSAVAMPAKVAVMDVECKES